MISKRLKLIVFSLSILLFSCWSFLIHNNWIAFQSLRFNDPLWLTNAIYPWLYIILILYLILFFIFYNGFEQKIFNVFFLSLFTLVIYGTPYIVSNYYRFPDTFYVVKYSLVIGDILTKKVDAIYPVSYPLSYVFFNIVSKIVSIDLFDFSRLIWAPFLLVSSIILWYIFVEKIFGSKVAMISSLLAIPTQIIEITTSPNSLGIFFVLILLILCTFKGSSFNFLFLILFIACVLTHSISFMVILIFLGILYLFQFLPGSSIEISINKLVLGIVLWFCWTLLIADMGAGITRAIYNIFTLESRSLEHLTTYTVSSGKLIYPWIQEFNSYKYGLYILLAAIFFLFDLNYIFRRRISGFNVNFYSKKLMFLIISVVFFFLTLINLLFGGPNTENIISRTLNYSMLALSAYISASYFSFESLPKISKNKLRVLLFIFIFVVTVTYPTYSYARDSYINYPLSERYGDSFFIKHQNDSLINRHSKTLDFFNFMRNSQNRTDSFGFQKKATIYQNGWSTITLDGYKTY